MARQRTNKVSPGLKVDGVANPIRAWWRSEFVLYLAITCIIAVLSMSRVNRANDLFWQIRTGQAAILAGPPHHDTFTLTEYGKTWYVNEWLSFAGMAAAYQATKSVAGGFAGIWFLQIVFLAIFGIILFLSIAISSKSPRYACILSCFALCAFAQWLCPRPQLWTYIFLAILSSAVEQYVKGSSRRILPCLVILVLIWANLHQGVVTGVALLFLQSLRCLVLREYRSAKLLALTSLCSLLASLATPYGVGLYLTVWDTIKQHGAMQGVLEWMPYSPQLTPNDVVFLMICLLALVSIVGRDIRYVIGFALVYLPFVVEAFSHVRNVPIATIVLVTTFWSPMSKSIATIRSRIAPGVQTAIGVVAGCAALAGPVQTCLSIATHSLDQNVGYFMGMDHFPWEAVSCLQSEQVPTDLRQYNDLGNGGLLEYARPEQKTFIDGRLDLFDPELLRAELELESMRPGELVTPAQAEFLKSYDFDDAVVTAPCTAEYFAAQPDWSVVYVHHVTSWRDDSQQNAWIFIRNRPQLMPLIEKMRADWARLKGNGHEPVAGY